MKRHLILILMAAGNAKRFGKNKLQAEIDGKPMYRHILEHLGRYKTAYPEDCDLVVVSQFRNILEETEHLGGKAIENDRPEDGISRTIRLSLEGLPAKDDEAAVFFTADQPYLTYDTVERFLLQAAVEEKGILSARSGLGMGNPVSFDKKYYGELRALKDDEGGRLVALAHENDTAWFEADDLEMRDIDRPGDVVAKA